MARVRILPEDCTLEVSDNESALSAARRAGLAFTSACGGQARCSTCRVHVESGLENCKPRTEKEVLMADRLALTPSLRLGCQLQLSGDATIRRLALDERDAEVMQRAAGTGSLTLVGQEKRIAIFFSDIRGFTSFSERLPPFDVIHVLNRYFNEMGAIVEKNEGCVDNYLGDGIMAIFGVPKPCDAPMHAVTAGLQMLTALEDFKVYMQRLYGLSFDIGIGIHWGDAVVGSLGTEKSRRTTAIGDAVNFAARIESANKDAGTRLLVSEPTYEAIKDRVIPGRIVALPLKGKTGVHSLYEITGLKSVEGGKA